MLTLLVTETSHETGLLCRETLAGQDIVVNVCPREGPAAYAELCQLQPDAVLLDIFMPGMAAVELKKRYDRHYPAHKTVFFAAGPFQNDILDEELREAGFAFYFLKPLDFHFIGQRIHQSVKASNASGSQLLVANYYRLAGLQQPQGEELLCLAQLVEVHAATGYSAKDILSTPDAYTTGKGVSATKQMLQAHCNRVALALRLDVLDWRTWLDGIFDAIDYRDEAIAL